MTTLFCPTHPSAHLIEDHRAGDVVCPECGLVVGDRFVFVSFLKNLSNPCYYPVDLKTIS